MAPDEKQQKKKLKEAQKIYTKSFKAFKQGKITKDELKERLRPYKYELRELGYPVKIKDDDPGQSGTVQEKEDTPTESPITISYKPWNRRSTLTVEEIETRIDMLDAGRAPSESLKRLYEARYGEELPPPEDLIPFERADNELPARKSRGDLPPGPDQEEDRTPASRPQRRPFLKSLFKGSKEAKTQ